MIFFYIVEDASGICCNKIGVGQAESCYMKNVIGENIKRLRKQQEIKQAVLAAKLNIGRQTLSAYERGVTLPDVLALIEIADYFGVSLDELTGRSELIIPNEKE